MDAAGTTIGKHIISNDEVIMLADIYQRIADQRRIKEVNDSDARANGTLIGLTIITLLLFMAVWVV